MRNLFRRNALWLGLSAIALAGLGWLLLWGDCDGSSRDEDSNEYALRCTCQGIRLTSHVRRVPWMAIPPEFGGPVQVIDTRCLGMRFVGSGPEWELGSGNPLDASLRSNQSFKLFAP